MELISHGLAELLRPVIALLVKGLFSGVVLLLTAPVVIVRFLLKKMNEGQDSSDVGAGCSASTFILVAEAQQSLHPDSSDHRPAHRKGPLNAENAVRTTRSSDCRT